MPRSVTESEQQTSTMNHGKWMAPQDFTPTVNHVMISSVAGYLANGGVGILLIGGIIFKTIGWRFLATGASAYGLLYAYERLSWNNVSKQRVLKNQIRSHLSQKLQQSSKSIAISCEDQVSKEVEEVLNRMKVLMSEANEEMTKDVHLKQKHIAELENVHKQLVKIKNRGAVFNAQLDDFLEDRVATPSSL